MTARLSDFRLASALSPLWSSARRPTRGVGLWNDEPLWPWAAAAALAWAVFFAVGGVPSVETSAGSAVVVVAAASSVAAVYVRNRREEHNEWVRSVIGGSTDGTDPWDLVPSDPVPVSQHCPCGERHLVSDPGGYFVGMARWVLALQRLSADALDVMEERGAVELDVWSFADDTEALAELLLDWCHGADDLKTAWLINGLVASWEPLAERLEERCAELVGPSAYRRWRAETLGTRNARHGSRA